MIDRREASFDENAWPQHPSALGAALPEGAIQINQTETGLRLDFNWTEPLPGNTLLTTFTLNEPAAVDIGLNFSWTKQDHSAVTWIYDAFIGVDNETIVGIGIDIQVNADNPTNIHVQPGVGPQPLYSDVKYFEGSAAFRGNVNMLLEAGSWHHVAFVTSGGLGAGSVTYMLPSGSEVHAASHGFFMDSTSLYEMQPRVHVAAGMSGVALDVTCRFSADTRILHRVIYDNSLGTTTYRLLDNHSNVVQDRIYVNTGWRDRATLEPTERLSLLAPGEYRFEMDKSLGLPTPAHTLHMISVSIPRLDTAVLNGPAVSCGGA